MADDVDPKKQETSDRLGAIKTDRFLDPETIMMMEKNVEQAISGDQVILRRIEDDYIKDQIDMLMGMLLDATSHNVRRSNTQLIIQCVIKDHGLDQAERIASSLDLTVDSLMRVSDWMTLDLFGKLVDTVEELYGTPMAIYNIARRIHKLSSWGLADACVKVLGSFGQPIMGFESVEKGMGAFNNTKKAKVRGKTKTSVRMQSRINDDIDPMKDIQSRFFVPGIICSIPEIWMMLAALFDELYLQFEPVEMLKHYQARSEKMGWGLAIDDPHIDENGILIVNGQRYGQRVKVKYDEKGFATITSLNSRDCSESDPVFIEKGIILGVDEENGNVLCIIREGQLTNMPYTLYEYRWQNPTWNQIGRIFWNNSKALGSKIIELIKSFSFDKLMGVFTSPRKVMLEEIERERQKILEEFDTYRKQIDKLQEDLDILRYRNEDDRRRTLLAWTKKFEMLGGATPGHVERVKELGLLLWDYVEPSLSDDQKVPRETMEWALELHDVGKIGIPEHILKKQGELTDTEAAIMKSHAYLSEKIMMSLGYEDAAFGAYHHERIDGSGYVYGLTGDQLPITKRLPAIADIFDALCTPREYKPAFSQARAIEILRNDAKRNKIDANLVERLVELTENNKAFFTERYGKFWET